jgi:CheY-like chemotaxis protein
MADTPEGRRMLTLRTLPGLAAGTVTLEVQDSGPGVPEHVRRRIFEPFFTTKPHGQGTGVGLSFSLGLAEAHGGRLELAPSAVGACFRLTLPIEADPIGHDAAPETTAAIAPPARRALVVDDEREIAEALADFLSLEGFACDIAEGARAAQSELRQSGGYDLIVSDLRMPGMDGPELYAWLLRERPELAPRMGFATGDTLGAGAARFLAEAKRPVLEKPFMPDAVRRFLQQMDLT